MPPECVCAAAGRAEARDAPMSAPRISRRWGLELCMGGILALRRPRAGLRVPRRPRACPTPTYSAGAAAATAGAATASGAFRFLGVCWALRNAAQRFLVAAIMRAFPSALSTRFCGLGAAALDFAALKAAHRFLDQKRVVLGKS